MRSWNVTLFSFPDHIRSKDNKKKIIWLCLFWLNKSKETQFLKKKNCWDFFFLLRNHQAFQKNWVALNTHSKQNKDPKQSTFGAAWVTFQTWIPSRVWAVICRLNENVCKTQYFKEDKNAKSLLKATGIIWLLRW